jgi:rhamnosyl/mannosyltransferase
MIGTPLILSVGRLVYYKGFCHLIDAMKDTAAHLLIVGSGPLENELRSQISELGLVDKVHLVSSVPDLVPYYHACDLFVLPSSEISEVFGIVQIEALASGKPVINTDLPTGVPEVSVHGETGLTVKSKDSIALRSALQKILSDRRAYAQFSHKAISRARSLFSNRAMCESLDRSLREVLSPLPQRTVGHPHPAEPATAGD